MINTKDKVKLNRFIKVVYKNIHLYRVDKEVALLWKDVIKKVSTTNHYCLRKTVNATLETLEKHLDLRGANLIEYQLLAFVYHLIYAELQHKYVNTLSWLDYILERNPAIYEDYVWSAP